MAADPLPLMDCRIVFRCPECSESMSSLPQLEKHLWQFHLNDFAYRCALCGLPALSTDSLREHYAQTHEPGIAIEYKRKVEQELCLKDVISRSITVEVDVVHSNESEQRWTCSKTEPQLVEMTPQHCEEAALHHEVACVEESGSQQQPGPSSSGVLEENQEAMLESTRHRSGRQLLKSEFDEETLEANEQFLSQLNLQVPLAASGESSNGGQDDSVALLACSELEPIDSAYRASSNDGSWPENADTFSYVDEHGKPITLEEITQAMQRMERVVQVNRKPATYYRCELCDKVIRYPSKIAEHVRSHTGEKPFQCRFCGTGFSQRGALNCHERLHTGERPYKCSFGCGRSFVSSSAQRVHEKVHNGERKYHCPQCPQAFLKKFHLDRHERRHKSASALTENATGIDAAGDYAYSLFDTVTDVIDSVHLKTTKRIPDSPSLPAEREGYFPMDDYMPLSI